jgi:hypothetical protein
LGQYCNLEIAVKTFVLVSQDTLPAPFTTRDTVAVETPASLATSFTVHDRTLISVSASIIISSYLEGMGPFADLVAAHRSQASGIRHSSFLELEEGWVLSPSP